MAPTNLAGQTSILARYLRKAGASATSLVFTKNKFGYSADVFFPLSDYPRIVRYFIKVPYFLKSLFQFDVFHFHGGSSLFSGTSDLPIYRFLGKKVVMHFHGSEIRNPQLIIARGEDGKVPPTQTTDQIARLEFLRKYVDKFIVSTPDLLEIVPEAAYLPNSVGEEWFSYKRPKKKNKNFVIVHAPTNRKIKGTDYVISACENLKKQGYNVELRIIENVPNQEVMEIYSQADVAVDWLLLGWYGVFSIENMALGNPVVAYIDEDLKEKFAPDLPIINATKETVESVLENLIKNKSSLKSQRRKFKDYARKNHYPLSNARKLLKIYRELDV